MFLRKNGSRFAPLLSFGLFLSIYSCINSSDNTAQEQPQEMSQEVVLSQGIQTSVEEVLPDSFLISDEVLMNDPDSSRVVAKYLDGRVDTVYVKEIQEHHTHYHNNHGGSSFFMNYLFFRAITGGYMGYNFGRPYYYSPSPAYYRDRSTYDRVRNSTGSTISNTMRGKSSTRPGAAAGSSRTNSSSNSRYGNGSSSNRNTTTKPSSGRSGYGRSSGSSRSYGG